MAVTNVTAKLWETCEAGDRNEAEATRRQGEERREESEEKEERGWLKDNGGTSRERSEVREESGEGMVEREEDEGGRGEIIELQVEGRA